MLDVREAGGGWGGPERGVQPHPGHHPAQPRRLGARGQPVPGLRPPPVASPSDYRQQEPRPRQVIKTFQLTKCFLWFTSKNIFETTIMS